MMFAQRKRHDGLGLRGVIGAHITPNKYCSEWDSATLPICCLQKHRRTYQKFFTRHSTPHISKSWSQNDILSATGVLLTVLENQLPDAIVGRSWHFLGPFWFHEKLCVYTQYFKLRRYWCPPTQYRIYLGQVSLRLRFPQRFFSLTAAKQILIQRAFFTYYFK